MRLLTFTAAALVAVVASAFADAPRYFAVWSYTENAPAGELAPAELEGRSLGYWALEFDDAGGVVGGTYFDAGGQVWLSLRYVEESGRIYADLYGPSGERVTRKSTPLHDRTPRIRP